VLTRDITKLRLYRFYRRTALLFRSRVEILCSIIVSCIDGTHLGGVAPGDSVVAECECETESRDFNALTAYMLNTRSEEENTGIHSYLDGFVNIVTLHMYGFVVYKGLTM